MTQGRNPRVHERWARLRFSIVGQLLAAPPQKGGLRSALAALAAREWRHPATGKPTRFGLSTIERWYYRTLRERQDPVGALRRKQRRDAGQQASMGAALRQALLAQYAAHKSWSAQLHYDNLVALAETRPEVGPVPSYSTVRRYLRTHGLDKRRRLTSRQTAGALAAELRLTEREVRSFEAEYVGTLLHWDFHHCSRKVLTARGEWRPPLLLGILDDRSHLACHLQWYLAETAENVAHGLAQAFQKRGLPRAAMLALLALSWGNNRQSTALVWSSTRWTWLRRTPSRARPSVISVAVIAAPFRASPSACPRRLPRAPRSWRFDRENKAGSSRGG